jgi:hypothetical protein
LTIPLKSFDFISVDKRTKQEHIISKRRRTMKNILEDIATVCTLLGMGTAIIMWGSIGQVLASVTH